MLSLFDFALTLAGSAEELKKFDSMFLEVFCNDCWDDDVEDVGSVAVVDDDDVA